MLFNIVLGIWVAAGIVIGFAIGPARDLQTTPIAFFHVPMAVGMETAFLVAAWNGGRWLISRKSQTDRLSLSFAEVGTCFGLIATLTGAIFSRANWGEYWNWDPKQIGIVATLLTYAALFALRGATEDEDKARDLWAVYAIIGLLSALFWTGVFPRLPQFGSLHPSTTLVTSAPSFKRALWFNIIGAIGILCKLASLRARLEAGRETLKARRAKELELEWAS